MSAVRVTGARAAIACSSVFVAVVGCSRTPDAASTGNGSSSFIDSTSATYVPHLCPSEPIVPDYLVGRKDEAGTISIAHNVECDQPCLCSEEIDCSWEIIIPPAAQRPGLFEIGVDVEATCITCDAEMGEIGALPGGSVEIVRADETGIAGCFVDWLCTDSSFEVTSWCP